MDFINNYWSFYWYNLHHLSVKYPDNPCEDQKKQIMNLINKMQTDGIPCPLCRNHFKNFVKKNDMETVILEKKNLFTFFLNCHNDVNIMEGKNLISYDEAFENYSKDIVIKCKEYKWDEILSVKEYGKQSLIIELFNNNTLETFPDIFNIIYKDLYKKINNLLNGEIVLFYTDHAWVHK